MCKSRRFGMKKQEKMQLLSLRRGMENVNWIEQGIEIPSILTADTISTPQSQHYLFPCFSVLLLACF